MVRGQPLARATGRRYTAAMTRAPATLWTRSQAAAADRHTIVELGTPSPVLMERAALCCAREALALRGERPVWTLCGPGNNGGDGVAVARILHGWGVPARAFLLTSRQGPELAQQLPSRPTTKRSARLRPCDAGPIERPRPMPRTNGRQVPAAEWHPA